MRNPGIDYTEFEQFKEQFSNSTPVLMTCLFIKLKKFVPHFFVFNIQHLLYFLSFQLDDASLQVFKDGDYGAYLDLESSLAEQSEEIEGLHSG